MGACLTYNKKPKVRHPDKESAYDHLRQIQPYRLHKMHIYRCRVCRFWHVGRIPGARKLRIHRKRQENREEALVGIVIKELITLLRKSS